MGKSEEKQNYKSIRIKSVCGMCLSGITLIGSTRTQSSGDGIFVTMVIEFYNTSTFDIKHLLRHSASQINMDL